MYSTKLTTPQRIQIGLVFSIAFLLVLGSNRLNQRYFSTIKTTVNSVFEDRVVVQDFIYQLNNTFHKKELRLVQGSDFKNVDAENKEVEKMLVDFGMTKMTHKEANLLNELNRQFSELQKLENKVANPVNAIEADMGPAVGKTIDNIQLNLDELAKIQLTESAELTEVSNKSLGMNSLLSKLEVSFLIILGIAMLFLIIYPVKRLLKTS